MAETKIELTQVATAYKFSAYMGSTQTTVASAWTKLNMNIEEYDTNNNFNTSTFGYTVPVTGYYSFTVMCQMLSQAGALYLVGFSKDGTTEWLRGQEIPNTTGNITLSATHIVKVTAGEVIYPVYYSSTAGKTLNNGSIVTRFSGYLLGV